MEVLFAMASLAFVACIGMFIAFMRTHSYEISETLTSVLEAIQDIKAYKASRMK